MDGTEHQLTDAEFRLYVVALLSEIRDLLRDGVQASEAEEDDGTCKHPEDKRVGLGTAAFPDRWICSVCRYEHTGIVHN